MPKPVDYISPNFLRPKPAKELAAIAVFQILFFGTILQLYNNPILPHPIGILKEFYRLIQTSDLWVNLVSTFIFVLEGMGIAVVISMLLCYMVKIDILRGISKFTASWRYSTYQCIVFIITVTLHDAGMIKLWTLVFAIVPFFVTSLIAYVEEIPQKEYELCYTLKMNRWQILYEVIVRGKLHLIWRTIKHNLAVAFAMIIALEYLCWSQGGIGTMLVTENRHFRMDTMFALVLIIFLLGLALDYFYSVSEVYLFPYTNTRRFSKLWVSRKRDKNVIEPQKK